MESLELTSVHEALAKAASENIKETQRMVVLSTKVSPDVEAVVQDICRNHGTTISAYLRKCCESLVADYVQPKS